MSDLYENPMGLMGFEFVEFASPAAGVLEPVLRKLGFSEVARHRSKDVSLYRQGEINFIVNREPGSIGAYFAAEHGPSACGLAFRVRDATRLTPARSSAARSRSTSRPARWSCACRRSRASAARRCT